MPGKLYILYIVNTLTIVNKGHDNSHTNLKYTDISGSLFIDVEMMSCEFEKTRCRDCRTNILFIEPEESAFAIDLTGTAAVAIRTKLERG